MRDKTVCLTGASGNMGYEGLKRLSMDKSIQVKVLAFPDRMSRKKLRMYRYFSNVEIIWGDLTNYQDVLTAVSGSDYVLHVGALVSPLADYYPDHTEKVNYGGTLNIIKAINEQENPDKVYLVFIGSVAEIGERLPPTHWGRVGDPIRISKFDEYAKSKVKAERAVIQSGLKHWVSLRQTGMLHYNIMNKLDPIIFHQPLNTHVEWVTAEDSGRLLYNICTYDLPEHFWRNTYTIGGGEEFRHTYDSFLSKTFSMMGVRNYHKLFNSRWFAKKNFHCCWFEDSDILNNFLNFRQQSFKDYLNTLKIHMPLSAVLLRIVPSSLVKRFIMKSLAKKKHGPLFWIRKKQKKMINAFWGSEKDLQSLPYTWGSIKIETNPEHIIIDHGYDERKPPELLTLGDLKSAAVFRGGKCLSISMEKGDFYSPLEWECSEGHRFRASPYLVLKSGHWCPRCDIDTAHYLDYTGKNKFLAQVVRSPAES